MTFPAPACMTCRHYRRDARTPSCTAFPERIPDLVWLEGNPHREPVPGDNGIRYEKDPRHDRT